MFTFADCELDPDRYELRRHGNVVHVEPQVFAVLLLLVRHRDRVVRQAEMLDTVWGSRCVTASALTSRVKAARRAIGDDGTGQRMIRTVRGVGYRFVAPIDERVDTSRRPARSPRTSASAAVTTGSASPSRRLGSGPVLVKAANWMTHLGFDVGQPVLAPLAGRPVDGSHAGAVRRPRAAASPAGTCARLGFEELGAATSSWWWTPWTCGGSR